MAAQNTSAGAFTKINFDTEDFDSNNNFDSTTNFRYTAPVAGFYQFNAGANVGTPGSSLVFSLYKNGAEYQRGDQLGASAGTGVTFNDLIQSAANDFWEMFIFATNTTAMTVTTAIQPYFSGFLVTQT